MTEPFAFIPPSLQTRAPQIPVTKIILAVSSPVASSAQSSSAIPSPVAAAAPPRTNHWVFHLVHRDSTIRLDPSPTAAGESPAVFVFSQASFRAGDYTKIYTLDVREGVSVQSVIDVVRENGLGRYLFDSDGNGCRQWASTFLAVLKQKDFVISDIEDARDGLSRVWDKGGVLAGSAQQSTLDRGRFY